MIVQTEELIVDTLVTVLNELLSRIRKLQRNIYKQNLFLFSTEINKTLLKRLIIGEEGF